MPYRVMTLTEMRERALTDRCPHCRWLLTEALKSGKLLVVDKDGNLI
jgi:hypothetical protein